MLYFSASVLKTPFSYQPHLAPNHVVARRRVADEDDAVDEVLLAFLNPQRDVDGRRTVGAWLRSRRRAALPGAVPARRGFGIVAELVVRDSR